MVKIFGIFGGKKDNEGFELEYDEFVEISSDDVVKEEVKYKVKPLVIQEYMDIKPAIKLLREGEYILLINTKNLKIRDPTELKRVVDKLKQIVEKLDGDIIGFGKGEWLLVMPTGIKVDRGEEVDKEEE
jgi:SepF-like predicted cell division protein (DUF552 family)